MSKLIGCGGVVATTGLFYRKRFSFSEFPGIISMLNPLQIRESVEAKKPTCPFCGAPAKYGPGISPRRVGHNGAQSTTYECGTFTNPVYKPLRYCGLGTGRSLRPGEKLKFCNKWEGPQSLAPDPYKKTTPPLGTVTTHDTGSAMVGM